MNKDKLNMAKYPARTRNAAYLVITRTQDDPEVQVQAMALALFTTCNALKIDIRELLISMERMQKDLSGPFAGTFRAMEEYAKNEIGSRSWS